MRASRWRIVQACVARNLYPLRDWKCNYQSVYNVDTIRYHALSKARQLASLYFQTVVIMYDIVAWIKATMVEILDRHICAGDEDIHSCSPEIGRYLDRHSE